MKIIEFVGLPGSGKSTICDKLERQLIDKGYKVANLQKDFPGDTILKKIYRKYIYMKSHCSLINRDFQKIVSIMNIPDTDQYQEWIEKIKIVNYRIYSERRKYDFILLDEGLLQFITSMYHGMDISNEKDIKRIIQSFNKTYLENTEIIRLSLDKDYVCEHIIKRNRLGDRFLCKDKDKMILLLDQKQRNLDYVTEVANFVSHRLNGNQKSVDELTNEVITYIV